MPCLETYCVAIFVPMRSIWPALVWLSTRFRTESGNVMNVDEQKIRKIAKIRTWFPKCAEVMRGNHLLHSKIHSLGRMNTCRTQESENCIYSLHEQLYPTFWEKCQTFLVNSFQWVPWLSYSKCTDTFFDLSYVFFSYVIRSICSYTENRFKWFEAELVCRQAI